MNTNNQIKSAAYNAREDPHLTNSSYAYVDEYGRLKNSVLVSVPQPTFLQAVPAQANIIPYPPMPFTAPIPVPQGYYGYGIPQGYGIIPANQYYGHPPNYYRSQSTENSAQRKEQRGRQGAKNENIELREYSVKPRGISPNPYANLPQYRLDDEGSLRSENVKASLSRGASDVNTEMANDVLSDVFAPTYKPRKNKFPMAPAKVTLNKFAMGADSMADLRNVRDDFEKEQSFDQFEQERGNVVASPSAFGKQVLRDYSIQSLEDLRDIPDFIETLNLSDGTEKPADVLSHDVLTFYPAAV